jgi:1-deoxy-D-xylulose-5-phosphate synthase
VKNTVPRTPVVGTVMYDALHGIKKGIKDMIAPQAMFEDLGLKYVGPIDGHDEAAVEHALRRARGFGGPVIVHCITQKGHGYEPAENDAEECFHGPGRFDPRTGEKPAKSKTTWTDVFSAEMVALGKQREDIVAITAAMLHPTGLAAFAHAYPERIFDVGIAEQHALTSAAGLALGGMHPVIALYATFLNRAFDQTLLDVALHRQPVTIVLDRSGATGDDGPSHNGMWDLSILQVVPGLCIAAPRDGARLRELLREAVQVSDGPTVVRYPKGAIPADIPAIGAAGGGDLLAGEPGKDEVLLVAAGSMATAAMEAAKLIGAQGIGVSVLDPRWVKPLDPSLAELAAGYRLVAVVEDNGRTGGVGDAVARLLRDHDVEVPVRTFGLPQEFISHAKISEVHADAGLTAQDMARNITEAVTRRSDVAVESFSRTPREA